MYVFKKSGWLYACIHFFHSFGNPQRLQTLKLFFLLHISDRFFFVVGYGDHRSKKKLEQLHGRLKKNPGLDRTLTLGQAMALHSAPPLSYQAIRELLIFEPVLHLPEAI